MSEPPYRTPRVAIVGAGGGVGSSVAFNLLLRERAYDLDLVDGRSGQSVSHEMDLQQVVAAGATGSVRVVEGGAIAGADVVVVSAAVPQTLNRSRLLAVRQNAAIVDALIGALGPDWPGVLIVVTNPVDVLVTHLVADHGFDRARVLGYTANDSLRLRTAVGELLGVPPARVDAWVLGEHGDGCVPLLDRIRVDGEPVELDADQRREVVDFVRGWYIRHVALDSGRSSTWATGHGVARMIDALAGGGTEPWPVSVVLDGEYGITGAAVGVPVRLGPGGVGELLEWDLAPADLEALQSAADAVATAATPLGSDPEVPESL